MADKTPNKHWYYPSSTIGCGLSIDDLSANELTCVRGEVTCPRCIERVSADKVTCEACRLGQTKTARPHVCDPAVVYVTKDWPYDAFEINVVLHYAFNRGL